RAMAPGDGVEQGARLREIARGQRVPGDEADAMALAVVENLLAGTVNEIVPVLHGAHLEDLRGFLDVGDGDLAQPRVSDDAAVEKRPDGVELLVARRLGIDAVKLPQVDPVDAEVAKALVRLLDEVVGPTQRNPSIRPGPRQASLGRNEDIAE